MWNFCPNRYKIKKTRQFREEILKKITALLIILALLAGMMLSLASCTENVPTPTPDDETENPGPDTDKENDDDDPDIKVPEYKDYGRDTKDFEVLALSYARPDVAALCVEFANISGAIREDALSFEDQLAMITAIEDDYSSYRTMYSLAEIFTYKDASSAMWSEEFAYLSAEAPKLAQAVEDLYVAAAQSVHVERFEDEYFGENLYEDYFDGGKYTDEAVELMSKEAEFVSEYNSLSTATVVIEYNGKRGTYDEMVEALNKSSVYYEGLVTIYYELYSAELERLTADIFLSLVNTRRDIADELGYESYVELAYDDMDYAYSPNDMLRFIGDIEDYVLPVYRDLYSKEFYPIFSGYRPSSLKPKALIDSLYSVYKESNEEFADIYAYMLQHGLYDVAPADPNRYEGAFTTYLHSNNSPYLFVTTQANALDYTSMAHEFGHFIDMFVNYGSMPSLELAEVSSQALELLTLGMLEGNVTAVTYKYLKYYLLSGVFETLIYQGFYSLFEHYAYTLAPGDVTLSDLEATAARAYEAIFGESQSLPLGAVLIPHLMVSPFYVQSYCTSIIPSVEIYIAECTTEGAGIALYTSLIKRGETEYSFLEYLECAGLGSPFDDGALKNVSNRIYYLIYGKYFFKEAPGGTNEI